MSLLILSLCHTFNELYSLQTQRVVLGIEIHKLDDLRISSAFRFADVYSYPTRLLSIVEIISSTTPDQ